MIRDGIFKATGITLLGLFIPWAAHLLCCPIASAGTIAAAVCYFILVSFVVWQAVSGVVARMRSAAWLQHGYARKIAVLLLLNVSLAGMLGFLSGSILQFSSIAAPAAAAIECGLLYGAAALVLTLLYEGMFLSKERELHVKIADQLDLERVQAEITALRAELDPHFIFNALTTVSHLTREAPETARKFTQKLAQVYKYFLLNKDRDLIPLQEELRFIEDYFFLLQIRYNHAVRLQLEVPQSGLRIMVVPCSLQLLVENAIKHNRFSDSEPLAIRIALSGSHVVVENELRRHACAVDSTRIGLLHLRQHYKLLGHRDFVVEENETLFKVQIPFIKP